LICYNPTLTGLSIRDRFVARWNTVAIFGVGLIGGSVGIALRQRGLAGQVIGIGRDASRLQKAQELGAISSYTTHAKEAARAADLAIVCTPVQIIFEHVSMLAEGGSPDLLITDAGSTKENLVREVEDRLPNVKFVGSHPLAGSDRSGVEFSRADLYEDKTVVVTTTERTDPDAVTAVTDFWTSLGANVVSMSPASHDAALARTSHVPHVIASALAALPREDELSLTAGGWLDTTRIAAADVELWRQILQENRHHVATELEQFRKRLDEFRTALIDNDSATITRLLAAGKQRRDVMGS
jgi:prephenate dehydrogenase